MLTGERNWDPRSRYGEPGLFTTISLDTGFDTPAAALNFVRRSLEPATLTLIADDRQRSACDLRSAQEIWDLCSLRRGMKILGDSRTYSVLFVALLRAQGYPARIRSAFVDYLEKGRWTARWLCEYMLSGAWILVDPQLDSSAESKLVAPVDSTHLGGDRVKLAGDAWLRCRRGREEARLYGIAAHRGISVLRESLYRDVCALNSLELLSTDHFFGFREKSSIPAAEYRLLDKLAELSTAPDEHLAELWDVFTGTPELDRSIRFRLGLAGAAGEWPASASELLDKIYSEGVPATDLDDLASDALVTDVIHVRGAAQNNLKDIDVDVRHGTFTVVTGLSGCGKSSLVFDTIYAASQRRFVESMSPFVRRYIDRIKAPKVQRISNLLPSVSIEQKTVSRNPRSTVGTITRISPLIRLLFSRAGRRNCVRCGHLVQPIGPTALAERLTSLSTDRVSIYASIDTANMAVIGRIVARASRLSARIAFDGTGHNIPFTPEALAVARDPRILIAEGLALSAETLRTAFEIGGGVVISRVGETEARFSDRPICPACRLNTPELTSQSFTANSAILTCATCSGTGATMSVDPDRLVANPDRSILDGALSWFTELRSGRQTTWPVGDLKAIATYFGDDLESPWQDMSEQFQRTTLYGLLEADRLPGCRAPAVKGLIPEIERLYRSSGSNSSHFKYAAYMTESACPRCRGTGLSQEALSVELGGEGIESIQKMPLDKLHAWVERLTRGPHSMAAVVQPIAKEIYDRTQHVLDVGLPYLSLSRSAPTLSGGEAQRLKIARQLGIGLTGILYVLDEPSIGLHARDQDRLLSTLRRLQRSGNTILVVEHDEATMRAADEIVDMGPGAGSDGGRIIAQGSPDYIARSLNSVTGPYLAGIRSVLDGVPEALSVADGVPMLRLSGARLHNLANVDLEVPLGRMTVVTGVSGSGKSSLVLGTLVPALRAFLNGGQVTGPFTSLHAEENLAAVLEVDQAPIGRTPRSCPATYLDLMDELRGIFARSDSAVTAGLSPQHFSFNSSVGQCPHCKGLGSICIEMHFLPDVWTECPECHGRRYSDRVLAIRWRGLSIADVLGLDIADAAKLFADLPTIAEKLSIVERVGLGYLSLGQNAVTLSGGEAQRLKLSRELLSKRAGHRFYVLDEPTTGLHFSDINKLLKVLRDLIAAGHTVVIVEHNLDVIRASDWIVDLGPEGGDGGGHIVYQGPVAGLRHHGTSHTGRWLAASDASKHS